MTSTVLRSLFTLLTSPEDGGGGGSSALPPAGGLPTFSTLSSTGGAGGGGGSAAPTPVSLADDTLVQFDGMDKPLPWKDVRTQRFVPKDVHDRYAQDFQKNFREGLQKIAQTAQQQRTRPAAGTPGANAAQPRADLFASLRNKSLISGQDVATLAEQIQRGEIAPLYAWAQQVNDAFAQVKGMLEDTRQVTGGLAERHSTQEYQSRLTSAIAGLGDGYDPQDPVLRALAEDIYLSHDPADPSLNTEFASLMRQRIEGLTKFVRAMDRKKLDAAKKDRSRFLRPGGSVQPGRNGRPMPESNADVAARLFAEPMLT